jgi:tetratricopeptide (TPR) repeat protein
VKRAPVAAALVCALLAVAATAAAPLTHDQALAALAKPDVEGRRQAAAWLGDLGVMADTRALVRALRDDDDVVRVLAERSLWSIWSRSGDRDVDVLFEQGVEDMQRGDAAAAISVFTAIVEKKPDFAEGWNKRATVYYLVGEYQKSLHDCDEVVKRNPDHFGALAGYGQIYLALDDPERALEYFQRALRVNPNLVNVEAAVVELKRRIIEKRKGVI